MASPSDYIAYYKLANDANDETGNYNGVNNGAVFNGESAEFDGVGYIESSPIPTGTSDFSISGWIKKSDASNGWVLNNRSYHTNSESEWQIFFYDADMKFGMFNDSNTETTVSFGLTRSTHSDYYFFTLVIFGTTMTTYIDNVQYQSSTFSGVRKEGSLSTVMGAAGWHLTNSAYTFTGELLNIRFYDYALTTEQITDIYNEEGETAFATEIFSDVSEDIVSEWSHFIDISRDLTPLYQTFSDASEDSILAPTLFQDISVDHQGYIQIFTDVSANNENIKWSRFYDMSGDETIIHEDTLIKRVTE